MLVGRAFGYTAGCTLTPVTDDGYCLLLLSI